MKQKTKIMLIVVSLLLVYLNSCTQEYAKPILQIEKISEEPLYKISILPQDSTEVFVHNYWTDDQYYINWWCFDGVYYWRIVGWGQVCILNQCINLEK